MNRAQRCAAQRERPIRTSEYVRSAKEYVRSAKLMNSQLIRSKFQKLDLTYFKFHIAFKKVKTRSDTEQPATNLKYSLKVATKKHELLLSILTTRYIWGALEH